MMALATSAAFVASKTPPHERKPEFESRSRPSRGDDQIVFNDAFTRQREWQLLMDREVGRVTPPGQQPCI